MSTTDRPLRVGVGVPNFGDTLQRIDGRWIVQSIEQVGLDSAWLTDHILLPKEFNSRYPFSTDGTFFMPESGWWYESLTTLAYLASHTNRIRLGIGVCVAALREPRLLSQQVATLDRLTGGRITLGVGAGWLREEFDAMEVPFDSRGDRLDGALDLMRACWTGEPEGGQYGPYRLPPGYLAHPTPVQRRVPILLAGEGGRALDRMVQRGDGWYGASGIGQMLPLSVVHKIRQGLAERCARAGRDPDELVLAVRLAVPTKQLSSDALVEALASYHEAGVSEITIDFAWRSPDDALKALEALAETVRRVRSAGS